MTEHTWLENKIALVTGAGRGIGRACALHLARAGADVIAVARTADDLKTLEQEAKGKVTSWVADITKSHFYAQIEALDQLDILVNSAGTNNPQLIIDTDDETLDTALALNVRAMYKTAQAATRVMLRSKTPCSIVNMSSQMGHVGGPKRTVYCMTKHAVEGFTKALALELAQQGVRVNSVAPTFVLTPMTEPMMEDEEFKNFVLNSIPMHMTATVDDVAEAVLFLTSPAARMITGTSLKVDGGWTAQ